MGKFEDGINGAFTGKVGAVIGYKWRGINSMRSLPRPSKKPRSPKQLANQARMKLMQKSLALVVDFVRVGFLFNPETRRMSEFNLAMSYNIKNAIKGEYPNAEIDFEKFMFAQGDLEAPKDVVFKHKDGFIEISWDPNELVRPNYEDQIMWCIIDAKLENSNGQIFGARRVKGKLTFDLGGFKIDREYHCYAAFIAGDRKQVSDSCYCGTISPELSKEEEVVVDTEESTDKSQGSPTSIFKNIILNALS